MPLSLALAACGDTVKQEVLEPPPPGLEATPRWLTFTCVEPGCDETLTVTVKVIGDRDLAVKRIVLSDRERADFVLEPGRAPPFVLKTSETFNVTVRFRPDGDPRLGDVDVLATFGDASANESEQRVPPGELKIPLVRRLIGEPTMVVMPDQLNFGAVLPGEQKTLPLHVGNDGFGNVGLVLSSVRSDRAEVMIENMPTAAILPMQTWPVSVVLAPMDQEFIRGFVTVRSADPLAPAPMVPLVATSLARARIAVEPEEGIAFGEVPVRMSASAMIDVSNHGAEGLQIAAIELINTSPSANLGLDLPRTATTSSIAALGSIQVGIQLAATSTPGPVEATLRITSNDPATPVLDVPVAALITEPNISVSPPMVDFGRVPRGWVVPRPVSIENTGYGDLVITNVTMVLGSSLLFNLRGMPALPVRLRHGQRIGVEVEFRSEAEASFTGTLSIDSSDPDRPFLEIPMTAAGASCLEGCPISNGTPSCTNGVCEIGMCNLGYYDTDRDAATGCECSETGTDPAGFCANAPFLGTLPDDNARANVSGILPTEDDVDIVRFFALDESQLFSEDWDVRVRLESPDPAIQFCIYRYDVGAHENACILENENCPANRSYRKDGSLGPDDSADFTIRVFRAPGAPLSCAGYTLFISND